MKGLISYGITTVVMAVAGIASGQSEIPGGLSSSSSYIQTSKLVGKKVKSSNGKEIGVIKDVVIDTSNGCTAYTVVSIGGEGTGVRSGGGKFVAIPWAVYSPTSDLSVLTVNAGRDKIYNAPVFEYTRMDEYTRPDYIDNVYSYYNVNPGPHTAIATGTDATGTAGATASPGEVVSPAEPETGSLKEKRSVHRDASSDTNSYVTSSTSPSLKAKRIERTIHARASIDRGETASTSMTQELPSESATNPSENKKSRRKATEDASPRKPSATPQIAEVQD